MRELSAVPSADALIKQVEPLAAPERAAQLAQIARIGGDGTHRLLAELGRRGAYERGLAVSMAAVARDEAHLRGAVEDPSPRVRAGAVSAVVSLGIAPDVVVELIRTGSREQRRAAYRRLRQRPAPLADALLPEVRAHWGDAEAAGLLAACSREVVAAQLPEFGHAVVSWSLLAARHVDLVRDYAATQLAATSGQTRREWWSRYGALVGAIAEHEPAAALELAERWLDGPMPYPLQRHLSRLLAVDADRVVNLLLAEPVPLSLSRRALRRLAELPDDRLGELLRAMPALTEPVLRALPPARREAVYDHANAVTDGAGAVLGDSLLELLPHWRRHAEVRRMLDLREVRDVPALRHRVASFLPYAEAAEDLSELTRRRDAAERAEGYALLLRCAARSHRLGEALAGLRRLSKEQDPVRSVVLETLTELPVARFGDSDLDALTRIADDALSARDVSWRTQQALKQLAFQLMWHSALAGHSQLRVWSLRTVERIGLAGHSIPVVRLDRLVRGHETVLFDRLGTWLVAALERDNPWPVIAFARSLGRRAWWMPQLQELLRRAVRAPSDEAVCSAVDLYLEPPRTRSARVAELIDLDRSLLTHWSVFRVVIGRRTDLLGHVLGGRRLRGRFASGNSRWVPLVGNEVHRWTGRQVTAYAKLLRRLIGDQEVAGWSRVAAVRRLVSLPGIGIDTATPYLDDAEYVGAALTGLGAGDQPAEALTMLFAQADGDHAHAALAAANRCTQHVPVERLRDILGPVLAGSPKVTARKAAAQLVAAHRIPGAGEMLAAAWRAETHRDVRTAIALACLGLLEEPELRDVVAEAVAGHRETALALAGLRLWDVAPQHRRYAAGLLLRLAEHPDPDVARAAYGSLCLGAVTEAGELFGRIVSDIGQTERWRAAAHALTDLRISNDTHDPLSPVLRRLLDAADDVDLGTDRDSPARQRIDYLVARLVRFPRMLRRQPRLVGRAADVLAAHAPVHAARLRCAVATPTTTDLMVVVDLLAGRTVAAASLAGDFANALRGEPGRWDPDDLQEPVDWLATREDAAAGLFAVRLAALGGDRAGWPQQWRTRLAALRRHQMLDVADAARAVYIRAE
ncbi:MAG: hypothetical protein ACRDT6_00710 [Micromonosporaceae bacterium]